MGKVIEVPASVRAIVEGAAGATEPTEVSFFEYCVFALDQKAPVDDLKAIDAAIETKRKVKEAQSSSASTLVLENDQFLVLEKASMAYITSRLAAFAMAYRPFARALEKGNVQDIDLSTKK